MHNPKEVATFFGSDPYSGVFSDHARCEHVIVARINGVPCELGRVVFGHPYARDAIGRVVCAYIYGRHPIQVDEAIVRTLVGIDQ